ncbi:hypothetical protein COD95_09285 [Bacillus thuringiensis]|uniref:hypothetical protein n=1 Tax=Bacillus thuringiensis TaxID=1428 RepID=UPI000BFC2B55|nr:hypothetical protein [Bacillus thuringiensis]PGW24542.1 hypothetical protein COD95_09285 [Bacillus thuringiensis]
MGFNECYFFNRHTFDDKHYSKPLNVSEFMNDLKEVFDKHDIESMKEGFIGYKDGQFYVVNMTIEGK